MEIPFCVLNLGIKTIVPFFKSVAGMKRELIWLFIFCLCNNFCVTFLLFGRFHCVFYLFLKFIRYVYRKLISKNVDYESDLHHVCVRVGYNKLNLCLVDNNLVRMSVCCKHDWFSWLLIKNHFVW